MKAAEPKKPTRADLDAATAALLVLRLKAEADHARQVHSRILRDAAESSARRMGLPFDPSLAPPLYTGDPALHKALWDQHYVVAAIEKALGVYQS